MNKAVFLDRDGVINKETGLHIFKPEDFQINPGLPEYLKIIQDKGYILIVITNQSGIAKGLYNHSHVLTLNERLKEILKKAGVTLTEIYYCPHHPDYSKCLCRKPDSLMLEKAIARFKIDPGQSFFVGDRQRDVEAAKKVGVQPVLIESNASLSDFCKRLG